MPKLQSRNPTYEVGVDTVDTVEATIPASNVVGPASDMKSLEWPETTGFIVQPHKTATSPAWGTPFLDAKTGTRIFPGTLGGKYPNALLRKVKGVFKEHKSETLQSVGPVNWFGEKISTKAGDTRRHILSYHGPASRHFADPAFQYGAESVHREVYYGGGLVGLAPGPVLGAGLLAISAPTKGTYPYHNFFLVVVCREEGKEVVYRRPCNLPYFKSKITEAQTTYLAQKEQPEGDPPLEGWRRLGEATPEGYDTPTTPYFFSADGRKASAMRYKDKEFDNLVNGSTPNMVTEKVGTVIVLAITEEAVEVSTIENDPPYAFTETGTKTEPGLWETPLDAVGHTHWYYEESMKSEAIMTGTQIVAVDYVDNEQILVRLNIDCKVGWTKDFAKGYDLQLGHTAGWPINTPIASGHANIFRADGTHPGNVVVWYPAADGLGWSTPRAPGDHSHILWYNTKVDSRLKFKVAGVDYEAVIEGHDTTTNPDSIYLSMSTYRRVLVRYFDPRVTLLIGHMEIEEHDWSSRKIYWIKAGVALTDMTSTSGSQYVDYSRSARSVLVTADYGGLDTWLSFNESSSWTNMTKQGYNGTAPTVHATGYANGTRAWNWTWSKRTYSGDYPTENRLAEKGWHNSQWNWFAWLPQGQSPALDWLQKGWRGAKLLGNNGLTGTWSYAVHPEGYLLGSQLTEDLSQWKLPRVPDQSKLYTVQSTVVNAETLSGGKRLYPVGTF